MLNTLLPKNLQRVGNFVALQCRSMVTHESSKATGHVKHRVPQKRASKLLGQLRAEEFQKLKGDRNYGDNIQAGDSVMIEKLPYITAKVPDIVKGLVISKTNRAGDTAIRLLNVEHGTPVSRRIVLYSPIIKNVTIMQKAYIHKGIKRVRRSKIYYVQSRHPDTFTVK